MKLIEQSAEIITQGFNLEDIYKNIEVGARNCYQSTPTSVTPKEFVERLIKANHYSPLEHGTIYLKFHSSNAPDALFYFDNPYSSVTYNEWGYFITTNYRVLIENHLLDHLKYLCEPTIFHIKRVTIKVTTSIAISREFNRHRVLSISESSTRYCNFSKDKFGNEVTFIKPHWYDSANAGVQNIFNKRLRSAEIGYMQLIDEGFRAEDARAVLPLDTATTVVYTTTVDNWNTILNMRSEPAAHPDARILSNLIKNEFKVKGI